MKAIITKIIPQTETKPTRIRASAEGVKSIIYSKNSIEDQLINFGVKVVDENVQRHAALLFRDANNWTHVGGNPQGPTQNLATGQLPNQDWVHCFIEQEPERQKRIFVPLSGEKLVVAQARVLVAESPAPETGLPICDAYHFGLLKLALEQLDGKA